MAINAIEPPKSPLSLNSKGGDTNSCRLIKIDFGPNEFLTTANNRGKLKRTKDSRSPYVTGDRVQLLSRVTERKIIHKKGSDFKSSFPLATNIYKASSDEFKAFKRLSNRKVKKSVLTLPNEPAPMPQVCTVSDVNESEYFDRKDEEHKPNAFSKKTQKRVPYQNIKARVRANNYEFYDRDARHCSQLDLDCSSTDMIKHGDGKRVSGKACAEQKSFDKEEFNAHDVWAVLRNINRFQFRPSPHISEESEVSPKKKKCCNRRRKSRQERRVIETRRTQEIAYIADFQVDSNSPTSLSRTNSIDRVTVIHNADECKNAVRTKTLLRRRLSPKRLNQLFDKTQNRNNGKVNNRPLSIKCSQIAPTNKIADEKKDGCKVKSYKSKDSFSSVYKDSLDSSNYYGCNRNPECSERTYTVRQKDTNTVYGCSDNVSFLKGDQRNGVNKVVLNNAPNVTVTDRIESQNRKPRLVTTMPSGAVTPKLTTADIKRKLSHIKYPLVILGKDQLGNSVKIMNYEAPQFDGLDEHIWPFMMEWTENKNKFDKRTPSADRSMNQLKKPNEMLLNRPKDKKFNTDVTSKKKVEHKKGLSNLDNVSSQQPKKLKPMQQFKDKMLRLLYKKSAQKLIEINNQIDEINNDTDDIKLEPVYKTKKVMQVDASTEIQPKGDLVSKELPPTPEMISAALSRRMNYDLLNSRPIWTKRKAASEFIENVIRKIKNGSYYSHDDNSYPKKKHNVDRREISIQTCKSKKATDSSNHKGSHVHCIDLIPKITNIDNTIQGNAYDPLTAIPGFDDALSALEIKSLNFNQISVKHCLTNVVVQFDVTVLGEQESVTLDVKKSISCVPTEMSDNSIIPLAATESHSKIFKCKTSILNAILPAEICSVLPKIMRNFAEGTMEPLPTVAVGQTRSNLSVISELTRCERPCRIKPELHPVWITPELKKYQGGQFSSKNIIQPSKATLKSFNDHALWTVNYDLALIRDLITPIVKPLFYYDVELLNLKMSEAKETKSAISSAPPSNNQSLSCMRMANCTAVQLYMDSNRRLFPAFQKLDFMRMMETLISYRNFHLNLMPTFTISTKVACDLKKFTVNMVVESNEVPKKIMTVTINKLKIDSLFSGFLKRNAPDDKIRPKISETDASVVKSIEYNSELVNNKTVKKNNRVPGFNNKTKRKGFVKLYKRCKSTSNIVGERSCTPLSKITNLDDFFQALGSGKMLSSVFDGCVGRKLITSMFEMRSWITDITPRQAMLVLLLTNKKDTPNLLRFRPILLQGIAVNRITRATELDMEIEVIEKENLHKLSQYDGITYLPTAVVNHDNLLEELHWIAKTTASDYQRPFDESSERLLKSLLEKRKKLNPSYLRVMARYVGLGLLKSPNKKN